MNDDFLRRARRPPPTAFANQLRERLRQQELAEPTPHRPSWRLWILSLLIGSTVLAGGTYIVVKHVPSLSSSSTHVSQTPSPIASNAPVSARQDAANRAIQRDVESGEEAWANAPSIPTENTGPAAGSTRDAGQSAVDSATSSIAGRNGPRSSSHVGISTAPPIRLAVDHELAAFINQTSVPARRLSEDVEVASTEAAFRAFCDETPAQRPDVVLASRAISDEEVLRCIDHDAAGLMGAKLGHVASVITSGKGDDPMRLRLDTLLLAVLKKIPSPDNHSRLIDNPYTNWSQIDPSLENRRIEVLGPQRDSPAFLVFAVTVLEPACDRYAPLLALRSSDRKAYEEICHTPREDGVYTSAPLDSNFVRQRLWSAPGAIAVVDYRFYSANSGDLLGSALTGASPTLASILNGSYIGARTFHIYVARSRYERFNTVSSFVKQYLRGVALAAPGVLISADGETDRWRSRPLELTEVRVAGPQRKQP